MNFTDFALSKSSGILAEFTLNIEKATIVATAMAAATEHITVKKIRTLFFMKPL